MRSTEISEKFSCDTSRYLLPTFRRPCYKEIKDIPVDHLPTKDVFRQWTQADGLYYHKINSALLDDDLDYLRSNVRFINNLRRAIRENNLNQSIKVYRGLKIDEKDVRNEYRVGLEFLWPTFSSTSKNKAVAQRFGNFLFEIDSDPIDITYRADIIEYSQYPREEEVLFYPYTGFRVTEVDIDERLIKLKSIDTLVVEHQSAKKIPESVTILDASRNLCVGLDKRNPDTLWWHADNPSEQYLIGQNPNGYWDAPYRYHHRNGYFIDKGNDQWEEYQENKLWAKFVRIDN